MSETLDRQQPEWDGRGPQQRSIEEWRAAVLDGREAEPNWDAPEPVGSLYLSEAFEHPEEPPLLCLMQLSDDGETLGEIWLRPADLEPLIADLRLQIQINYAAGNRRWLGHEDGPRLNMGLDRSHASDGRNSWPLEGLSREG